MLFSSVALVSGFLAMGSQVASSDGLADRAVTHRLGRVALTEQKLERMAIAKESFAERGIEPLPGFPFANDPDDQIKSMTAPIYAKTLHVVGLTTQEYVDGMYTIVLTCSGWVEKREITLYFQNQAQACSQWPDLVKRILK